jgi:hypothetical protein
VESLGVTVGDCVGFGVETSANLVKAKDAVSLQRNSSVERVPSRAITAAVVV